MPSQLNLLIIAGFVVSVGVLLGAGVLAITLTMKAKHRHVKRLARVSRKRRSRRIEFEEAHLSLLRQKQESNAFVRLSDRLAQFVPLLDTVRLRARMQRAGLSISVASFMVLSLIVSLVIGAVLVLMTGLSAALIVLPALLAGMLLVDRAVGLRGEAMTNRFMRQLPGALDTIIRGIRSGLPVIECIGTVGQEFDAPVGEHFRAISERVQLGEALEAAVWRVSRVIRRPEMDFLAISIAIQAETGGSLSDALANLADMLRKRHQMKLKVRAISSEARASAMIIGALPFAMLGLLLMMSPDYVMPLFTDPRGHLMLMAGLGSITVGAFIMWRMTQFEI